MMPSHSVTISLGSNIQPVNNLRDAVRLLHQRLEVCKLTEVWETWAVGADGPNFYNCAILAETDLNLGPLKSTILRPIEAQLGRIRTADKNAPRTIDLDVIVMDQQVIDSLLWNYAYLAVPVAQLLPALRNPKSGELLSDVAIRLSKTSLLIPHPEIISVDFRSAILKM